MWDREHSKHLKRLSEVSKQHAKSTYRLNTSLTQRDFLFVISLILLMLPSIKVLAASLSN